MRIKNECIRILIADDDEHILECYRRAFADTQGTDHSRALDALGAELFDTPGEIDLPPEFEVVACRQGQEAVDRAKEAACRGKPFDAVILDVRMPPGIDGVEAGSRIRALDPEVEIVIVTGFSDVPKQELERRVPPPVKLHYFNKPLSFMKLAREVAGFVGVC